MIEVVPDSNPTPETYIGGYVALSYPAGVDVAFVCQETASHVVVQYLKDPPYEETRDESQVLMRLSWPHPKGFTLRELSHLVFNKTELEVAKGKWAAVRANKSI